MGSLPHRNAAIAVAIISAVWVTAASAAIGGILLGVGGLVAFGAVGLVAGVLYAVGACRTDGSCGAGTASAAAPSFGFHCLAPAGLSVSSHS